MEDLIFFVISKETSQSTQRPMALTEEGVPDRDRQKLIREQEVLKEVRREGEGERGRGRRRERKRERGRARGRERERKGSEEREREGEEGEGERGRGREGRRGREGKRKRVCEGVGKYYASLISHALLLETLYTKYAI